MNKNNFNFLIVVFLLILFAIGGFYFLNNLSVQKLSAEDTVKAFYQEWVSYKGNPIVDRIYQNSDYITKEYSQKLDQIIDSFTVAGFDPVLCAQDIPSDIYLGKVAKKGDTAVIALEEKFSGGYKIVEYVLEQEDNKWQIMDIVCNEGQAGENSSNVASPAIQNLVGEYIRNNINNLSPQEAVLGGTFYVTSVRFIDFNTCIVDYEDGHIALTAKIKFTVPSAQEVKIESVQLEDTVGNSNFKRNGNLVKRDGDWQLIYEEPGKPALSVRLEFNETSMCQDTYQNKSCSPEYWEEGDRAQIIGYKQEGKVLVSNLRIVGEASKSISGD
jgi:hypothetical protein